MSDARWSLSVEEFGPVKQASVTLAPLTLFVGQNSSGKSHMASLIWALLNAPVVLLRPELARGPAYEVAKGVVQAIQAGEKRVVTADDWSKILAWINQTIADSSEPLLTRIFGCRDCKAQAISATPTGLPDNLPVRVTTY